MEEPVAYLGKWGLPGSEPEWPGRFVYEPGGGVEVEIIAPDEMLPLEEDGSIRARPVRHYAVIHGRVLTDFVTLTDVSVSLRGRFPGGYEARLRPKRAFVGAAYDPEDTISFARFNVGIDGLEDWSNTSGGEYKMFWKPEQRIELSYTTPPAIELGASGEIKMRLVLGPTAGGIPRRVNRFSFKQGAYLELAADTPQPYTTLDELAHRVRDFLSFVTGRGMHIRWEAGYIDADPAAPKQHSHRVQVYALGTAEAPNLSGRRTDGLERGEMLFTAHRNRARPSTRLERWLSLTDNSKDVLNLHLADRYNPGLPPEFKFLAIAQAVESFHARRFDTQRLPSEVHTRNVNDVVSATPKRLQEFVEARLRGANRRAARDCLLDLINRLPAAARAEIQDAENFAKIFNDTRNYYTHWNPKLERRAAKGPALHGLTVALRSILEALLLRELGFSKQSVDELLVRHDDYRGDLRFALELLEQ